MNGKLKRILLASLIFIITSTLIFITLLIYKKYQEKQIVESIYETFNEEKIQEKIENIQEVKDMSFNIDDSNVIGVIKIDKIKFEGLVYEGTNLDVLAKGVGHFESTPIINGNVCFAAHNTNKYWAKLHTLQTDDEITYTSMLGTRTYKVFNITEIDETDWTLLENTEDNIITLVTCVKGQPEKRLCVQAIEKI